ncbi:VOC family protein [Kocuria sp. HSID16901]|uniref:VOC family protein n=1 Tax=Kocuria sp. HSID16901 TaxID=2419505 RepID=UPI00065F8C51|nr:VOC family protein [Kocuria sp. HSID16901]RUQ21763.1 VOC family protein [Kocuria sp. HSID16901]
MTITPNIWSNGRADETAEFYAKAFRDVEITSRQTYPTEGLLDFQRPMAGKTLTVSLRIHDLPIALINAGDEFRPTPAAGFMINFDPSRIDDAADYLQEVHAVLSEGGRELMPLGEYPFSPQYAWVEDQYGVSWQLILTNPEGEPRPFLMPALMFCGPAQNRAAEATAEYLQLFPGSVMGNRAEYPEPTGPAKQGSVMFSDFRLGDAETGTWFTAMDSGVDQDFTFTEGFSLMVEAPDQQEIDRLWDTLSAHPDAVACGWCKDQFGLSWQVVPENLGELMSRPHAYEHLMSMGKIQISDF